jgi:tetratricopeptide (TPR) repeat protein
LLNSCSHSPQILIVEDTHWIDPTSKALLKSLFNSISAARILVLITSRHEASLSVSGSHTTRLELGKLTASQSRELVRTIMGSVTDEAAIVERLVSRSDGIPLYVEEMARAMTEGELDLVGQQDSGEPNDDGVAFDVIIPDALLGALYARLDALGERKWIAQVASVIGRVFDLLVLARLSGRSAATLADDISALLDSGLVESVRSGATHLFGFKHALVRDAAYSSLLRRDAQQLHGELALLYEREYPEMQQTQPEVVVSHLSQAGRWLDAAKVWLKAGEFATEVGSTTEAMTRLKQCLDSLNQVSTSAEVDEVRMRGQLALGSVINIHFGPANPEAHQALNLAAELAESLQDTNALVECLATLAKVKYNAGDFPGAGLVAARMVEIGEQHEFVSASVKGLTNSGLCLFAMGEFRQAQVELERAQGLVEHADPQTQWFECLVLNYRALTMHIMGEPGLANELCNSALERASTQGTDYQLSTLGNSLYLYWMQGNLEVTRRTARELSLLAEKTGHLMWFHQAAFFLGWADAVDGDESGLTAMEASMTRFRDAGELVEQSLFYGIMAEQYLAYEKQQLALEAVESGLELVDRLSERFFEVPLLQMKVRCLRGQEPNADDPVQITNLLDRAHRVALEQGAVAWEQTDRDGMFIQGRGTQQ